MEFHGQPLPSTQSATAAVAEDDEGQIQGVWFFQLAFHLEPLIIMDPRVNFKRLQKTIESTLASGTEYMCYTKTEHTDRMAVLAGFRELGKAWGKVVE